MRNAWAQVMCLAALVMLSVHFKVKHSVGLPRFAPGDDLGYFKVESALQYRYALMTARGEEVPEVDRLAQYPEGIRTSRELTMLMERLTGWTWRAWPLRTPLDFRMFVILWVAVVSSLSIAALYLAALKLTSDAGLAMACAWVYGASWAATGDFIGSYTFQCLGLPLIFWSFACFCASLEPAALGRGRWALAAGLLMALALGSWHVTRFYLAAFFAAAGWAAWRVRGDAARRGAMLKSLAVLSGCALVAGLAFPVLRETRFAVSPTLIAGWVLAAWVWRGPKAAGAALLAGAALFAVAGQASVEGASYGHAYRLLWDKARFLLSKPADPGMLHPESRLLWMGPFDSPSAGFLVFNFVPLVLVLLPRLVLGLRRGSAATEPASAGPVLADALLVLSAAGTAAMTRIAPFAAFFLCLASARLRFPQGSRLRAAVLAGLALVAAAEGLRTSAPYSRLNPFMLLVAPLMPGEERPTVSLADERGLLRWLKERGAGRPVLAHFGISGQILAYAGAPVLLNPKAESGASRDKIRGFLAALYGGEEGLGRFCAEHGAGLVVYAADYLLDESADGARYGAGGPRLTLDTAAVKLHFRPEKLKGFGLVYQNPAFRVFAVGKGPAASGPSSLPGDPVYDLDRFSPKVSEDGTLSLDVAGVLARMKTHRLELFRARLMARMGQREAALEAYGRALAAWPSGSSTREELDRVSGRPSALVP
ncbi:MAG: hypothetical protein HY924_11225 [Elusimicrobia bacterium]|nr:hypothetical protein [Elusimicrobiota bacterium]